jgi:deazaflavin-dependent oxidoreductase (nitroreductase family)
MLAPQRPMNGVERLVARFLVTRPGAWFGYHILPRLDRPLLYLTRGRFSMSPGQPILLLITTGAKTGHRRATPLLYLPDGDRVIILASNAGKPRHPAWYYNVRAHPEVTLYLRGRAGVYHAREAEGAEWAELWRKAVDYFAGFAIYEKRIARRIPILVLTPLRR